MIKAVLATLWNVFMHSRGEAINKDFFILHMTQFERCASHEA